ncbi:MAG: hypothetical protein ACXWLF_08990, partial [Myxococcaceae bacterium]
MTPLGPPTLHVRPTYRRPRLWPWIVLALVLLTLGTAEMLHRRRASPAPPPVAGAAGPRSAGASSPGGQPAAV